MVTMSRRCLRANVVSSFTPRHCPVVIHDLADDAGRIESRQSGQIDGRLGLSGANEDAATTGPERKHVSGTRQISRCRCWINRRPDGGGSVRCRDTRTRDPLGFDCHREGGFEPRGVLGDHHRNLQLVEAFPRHREANQAPAVPRHEVDGLGSDLLCGNSEVALILSILVVDDDDHLASSDCVDSFTDRRKRPLASHRLRAFGPPAGLFLRHDGVLCPLAYGAYDVFPDDIAFKIDGVADTGVAQIGVQPCIRHDLNIDTRALFVFFFKGGNGQADAIDSDGTLWHDVGGPATRDSRR